MARQLIDTSRPNGTREEFPDAYREALLQIVEAKINGQEIESSSRSPRPRSST